MQTDRTDCMDMCSSFVRDSVTATHVDFPIDVMSSQW